MSTPFIGLRDRASGAPGQPRLAKGNLQGVGILASQVSLVLANSWKPVSWLLDGFKVFCLESGTLRRNAEKGEVGGGLWEPGLLY